MNKAITLLLFILGLVSYSIAEIPERPIPERLVHDFANVLNQNECNQLENHLEEFNHETSTQIIVVTIPDLAGCEAGDFAQRLGEKWGIGKKENGLVILLKPKTEESLGQIFISPGNGLKSALPDSIINEIVVDNEMIPLFLDKDYFGGLAAGIDVLMDITRGRYSAEKYVEKMERNGGYPLLLGISLFFILLSVFGGIRRRRFYTPGRSLPFWFALGLLFGAPHLSGSFKRFSSGSGTFGGFAGGSIGGGGAAGSW